MKQDAVPQNVLVRPYNRKIFRMSKQEFRHFRIVVASPGDVAAERNIVDAVAQQINSLYKKMGSRVHLDVGRWERDVGLGFHEKGPQGKVDEDLRPTDCHAMIGIFWKRFGDPTVDGESPTEHEIRDAIKSWKETKKPEICLFFRSNGPAPQTTYENDQLKAIIELRNEVSSLGVYRHYETELDFQRAVYDQLLRMTWSPEMARQKPKPRGSRRQSSRPESGVGTGANSPQVPSKGGSGSFQLSLESQPAIVRSSGVAELVSDIVLQFTGRRTAAQYDIHMYSQPSINLTSRIDDGSAGQTNTTQVQLIDQTGLKG